MSHLKIEIDRYVFIGTVMHYILVISIPLSAFCPRTQQANLPTYSIFTLSHFNAESTGAWSTTSQGGIRIKKVKSRLGEMHKD